MHQSSILIYKNLKKIGECCFHLLLFYLDLHLFINKLNFGSQIG